MNIEIIKFKNAIYNELPYDSSTLAQLLSINNNDINAIFLLIGNHKTYSKDLLLEFNYYQHLCNNINTIIHANFLQSEINILALNALLISRRAILSEISQLIISIYKQYCLEPASETFDKKWLIQIKGQLLPYL